jgi:hypothetical protein
MMSSRRLSATLLIASMILALPGNRVDALESKPMRWLFAGKAVAALASNSDILTMLNGAKPFVMSRQPIEGAVPDEWNAVHVQSFKSVDSIRNALASNALSAGVKGVMYDYEKWRFTPEDEQRNPAKSLKEAANLVHARGLLFLAAPAVDLVPVLAPDSDRKRQDDTYLSLGLAGDAARYADVVDIQAQRFQNDPQRYGSFVRAAAAQARAANPKVIVLAGVSTQPGGRDTSADAILRAIQATRDAVDGYWLNIPEPGEMSPNVRAFRPDIALEVLRRLSSQ